MMDERAHFDNATLQLNDGDLGSTAGFKPSQGNQQTRKSPAPRTSRIPNKSVVEHTVKSMYSYKDGAFENAVELTNREIIMNEVDGEIKGAWLLTEIDHWDTEKERIVILCDHTLIIVRFDFVAMGLKTYNRLALHIIDKVQIGDLVYPNKSIMPARHHGGVRLIWDRHQELSLGQKWNPFASDIPYSTFSHHPLVYYDKEKNNVTYNVDDFYDTLMQALNHAYLTKRAGEVLQVQEGPIMIESYASLASMVFNQSNLGFSRERGGVSF